MLFKTKSSDGDVVSTTDIKNMWATDHIGTPGTSAQAYMAACYKIHMIYKFDGNDSLLKYNDKNARDNDFKKILELSKNIKTKGGVSMLDSIKNYLKKNEEVIITLVIIILIDQIIFKGAFKNKLTSIIDSMINKVTNVIEAK